MPIKVTVRHWHAAAAWTWNAGDDVCGICRMPFDGCPPGSKFPGDDSPVVWGTCGHAFHLQCISKWLQSDTDQVSVGSNETVRSERTNRHYFSRTDAPHLCTMHDWRSDVRSAGRRGSSSWRAATRITTRQVRAGIGRWRWLETCHSTRADYLRML